MHVDSVSCNIDIARRIINSRPAEVDFWLVVRKKRMRLRPPCMSMNISKYLIHRRSKCFESGGTIWGATRPKTFKVPLHLSTVSPIFLNFACMACSRLFAQTKCLITAMIACPPSGGGLRAKPPEAEWFLPFRK